MKKILISALIFSFILIISLNSFAAKMSGIEWYGDQININNIEGEEAYHIELSGKVSMISNDYQISCEYADFNSLSAELKLRENIEIKSNDYLLSASFLQGNIKKEELRLEGDVRLEGSDIKISSELMSYNNISRKAYFQKNAVLNYEDIRAKGDKITVVIEESLIIIEGNVKGERDGQSFHAERTDINIEDSSIKLSGKASLILPDRGEQ